MLAFFQALVAPRCSSLLFYILSSIITWFTSIASISISMSMTCRFILQLRAFFCTPDHILISTLHLLHSSPDLIRKEKKYYFNAKLINFPISKPVPRPIFHTSYTQTRNMGTHLFSYPSTAKFYKLSLLKILKLSIFFIPRAILPGRDAIISFLHY